MALGKMPQVKAASALEQRQAQPTIQEPGWVRGGVGGWGHIHLQDKCDGG